MEKRIILLSAILCLCLTGCGSSEQIVQRAAVSDSEPQTELTASETGTEESVHATVNTVTVSSGDYRDEELNSDWNSEQVTTIELQQDTASISGNGAATAEGSIKISAAGTYLLSGELAEGNITVDVAGGDVRLILNGVTISATDAPAIDIRQGDVILTLAENTDNTVSDGSIQNTDNRNNAAIYAQDDLVFNGSGALTVNGNYKNGIQSKDDLKFISGTYMITAENHGIVGKDSVVVKDGTYTIGSQNDGIQVSNTAETDKGYIILDGGNFNITSKADGLQAETLLCINGGDYSITTGGGSSNAKQKSDEMFSPNDRRGGMEPRNETSVEDSASTKGLKSYVDLIITDGTFQIDACDDAIHSNTNVTIEGGTLQISTGDDGIHADESLTISDGTIQIDNSYEGLEGYTLAISGGTIRIASSDDGINAAQTTADSGGQEQPMGQPQGAVLTISDGDIYVDAGGDGLDANGKIVMTGGRVEVQGPVMGGNGTLDYDEDFVISGGILLGIGSPEMVQELSASSTQGFITETLRTTITAGTSIAVSDSAGNEIFSLTAGKNAGWYIISTPEIESGQQYTVTIAGEASSVTAN